MSIWTVICWIWGAWLIFIVAYFIGVRRGRQLERQRVESLCHQAILERYSGSIRRVWNAVDSGATKLMSEDEFFGKEKLK